LPEFIRLIRFAKIAALIAGIWTIFYAILIVGWQITIFFREGSWPTLPLSSIFNIVGTDRGAILTPASTEKFQTSNLENLVEVLLRVPAIVALLLAAALLAAFYAWLMHAEKRHSVN
jgi:hypothetical protein